MSETIAQAAIQPIQAPQPGEAPKEIKPPGLVEPSRGPAADAPVAPPTEAAPKAQDDVSERIAQMARRERKLQQERQQDAQRVKELEAKLARFERLKEAPEEVLSEHGWDPDKYLERLATGKTPEPTTEDKVKSMQEELARLKKEREDSIAENEAKQRTQAEQKAIADYKQTIKTTLEQDFDRYEATLALNQIDRVFEVAQHVYESDPSKYDDPNELITISANAVEKEMSGYIETALKMKRYASRFKPTEQPAPEPTPQQTFGGPTLTARNTAATPPPSPRLTDEERMKKAMSMLVFKE